MQEADAVKTAPTRHYRANNLMVLGLAVLLLALMAFSFVIGRYSVSLREFFSVLAAWIGFPIERFWEVRVENVIFNIRMPRVVLAVLVGVCLSSAGAAYQGVFQNPMAAPDLLGASAGAAFGAAFAILNRWNSVAIMVSAFIFSLLTVIIVWLVSERVKGKKVIGLILAGIVISSLFQAGTSYIKLVADPNDQLPAITYWLMGSLSGADKKDILFALLPMALGLLPLFFLRWHINVLTLGDEEAHALGVNTRLTRLVIIIASTLTTAAAVSVSGTIGWVGLVVPHMARRLVGNNYRHLMPASMLVGGIFLLLVDDFSRCMFITEMPLGILTAFIGAPFFIYLIMKRDVA